MPDKNANNVDQIRDLIFGSQIKDFEAKFNQLETMLNASQEKLLKLSNDAHAKLQKETERSLEALEKKIDNLASLSQKEHNKLKELIGTTDETLHAQLGHQKDEFATKLRMTKENIADENQKMVENITAMKTEIEATLKAGLATLSDEKLSRDAMSQMFLDVAMQIQGTDVATLLHEEQKPEN